MTFIWFALAAAALVFVFHISTRLQLARLRRAGLYPQAGQASMADVERLLKGDLTVWAVRCYREIHGCGLRQAREAIANRSGSA